MQVSPPPRRQPAPATVELRTLVNLAAALTAACIGAAALYWIEPDPPPVACTELAETVVCVYEDGTVTGDQP